MDEQKEREAFEAMTEDQIMELAKQSGFFADAELEKEFPNGFAELKRRMCAFARALLAAAAPANEKQSAKSEHCNLPAAPAVPEGYVLVPVEPTEAMLEAGVKTFLWGRPAVQLAGQYRAMIAAAREQAND